MNWGRDIRYLPNFQANLMCTFNACQPHGVGNRMYCTLCYSFRWFNSVLFHPCGSGHPLYTVEQLALV